MKKCLWCVVAVILALGAVVGVPAAVSAQPTQQDIELRDRLIANQENLLNTYRCLFGVDTGVVPGGCSDRRTVSPGAVPPTPTQQDIDARDGLIQNQENLLNTYRCRFDVDTQLVPGGCNVAPLSAQEVYARVAPSIPIVVTAYGHGSGILIQGGYVITNHHVVWPNDFDHVATVVFPDGTAYDDVPVVATNPWADIAVLGPLETDKRSLPLSDGEQLPPGSDLYLIGYPAEYEHRQGYAPDPTITRGLLSRVRHWDGYDITLLQTDAAIAGGQSGGALVDVRGRVVGVSTWGWTEANFGVATSASDQAEIVELMLTETGWSSSFHEQVDPDDDSAREWDIDLAGRWDRATFFVREVAETIALEVDGSGEAFVWMADSFGWLIGFNDEDELVASGSAEIDSHGLYFVEVFQNSAGASSYTLSSSAALQPYYDEDGVILLADGQTSGRYAGVFDYGGDVDAYRLELQQGETVGIWTDSIDSDTALSLYDSESNILAEDDDSGPLGILGFEFNAGIEFEVPSTGTYHITVNSVGGNLGGSYIIGAEILSGRAEQPADPQGPKPEGTVRMARANWSTGYMQAAIYRTLLQELGYDVSDPAEAELGPATFYPALGEGEYDFWVNGWFPSHTTFIEEAGVADAVSPVGNVVVGGGVQGFIVDKATADANGITMLDDIGDNPEIAALFDVDGNGKADLMGCNAGWYCQVVINDTIAQNGWEDTIEQVSAEHSALFAYSVDRFKRGESILQYIWIPGSFAAELVPGNDVFWVSVANPLESQRGAAALPADQCPGQPCETGFMSADIRVVARNEFLAAHPAAAKLFELVTIPVLDIALQNLAYDGGANTEANVQAAADDWIAANRATIDRWLAEARGAAVLGGHGL